MRYALGTAVGVKETREGQHFRAATITPPFLPLLVRGEVPRRWVTAKRRCGESKGRWEVIGRGGRIEARKDGQGHCQGDDRSARFTNLSDLDPAKGRELRGPVEGTFYVD